MSFIIRRGKNSDTREMWEAHQRSIREICSSDYRNDQIEAWASFNYSHEHWVNAMKSDYVFVVEIDNKVEGFGHVIIDQDSSLKRSEILGLYFSPKAKGLGAGRKMINEIEKILRSQGIKQIVLSSTKTSKGFYQRMGFSQEGDENIESMRGTKLECYSMKKEISNHTQV